eukprot:7188573-Pyramimonas_sp.AAC.1
MGDAVVLAVVPLVPLRLADELVSVRLAAVGLLDSVALENVLLDIVLHVLTSFTLLLTVVVELTVE